MRRLIASLVVVVALVFPAAASAAGTSETPNGFCGAMNMLAATGLYGHAQGVGVQDTKSGMFNAMVRNNPDGDILAGHGNAGMWNAVDVSGCRS